MRTGVKTFFREALRGDVPTELLIRRGLTVGRNFNRMRGCIIDPSHCWLIRIGDNVGLAPHVHILAHDGMTKWYLDFTKIGLVQIGNNVFIGAGSIILPNVRIGDNVVIGAGSVVTRDIPDDSLALGNPARVVGKTSEYIEKNRQKMKIRPTFDEGWTLAGRITAGQKSRCSAPWKAESVTCTELHLPHSTQSGARRPSGSAFFKRSVKSHDKA